jgi:LytR_cpsA_psr family/LytR cell envelope-related transcriptional attenuator
MPAAPPQNPQSAGDRRPQAPNRRTELRLPGLTSARSRRLAFIGAEVVAVLAFVLLAVTGFNRVLNSRDGRLAANAPGPNDPNFEANVTPTAVALVLETDAAGALTSVVMLSITSTTVGSALFIPPATQVVDVFGDPPSSSSTTSSTTTTTAPGTVKLSTIAEVFRKDGAAVATQAVANLVGTSFTDTVTVAHDRMVQLLTPVAPLPVTTDAVDVINSRGVRQHRFTAGKTTLSANDAVAYLETAGNGESDVARMVRQNALWEAWFGAVAHSSDTNVVPGETTSGLGRYVRSIAPLQHRFTTLPSASSRTVLGEVFVPQVSAVVAEVAVQAPYPTSANPGDRIRVRLLEGTEMPGSAGAANVVAKVAALLVPANAQIVVIGNADSFDKATTQVVAAAPELHDKATAMQQALRVGKVVDAPVPSDAQDVTVIIGHDLADSLK